MGYSLREGLFDAGFVVLGFGFALAAAHLGWPKGYFLIGILAIAGVYGLVGNRYIDQTVDPLSKKNLCLTDQSLLFIDWRERGHTMHWDQVRRIGISRHESAFPDPWVGDYLEQTWFLVDRGDKMIEIPLELAAEHDLAETLGRRFAGFDAEMAQQALRTQEEGTWVLWSNQTREPS